MEKEERAGFDDHSNLPGPFAAFKGACRHIACGLTLDLFLLFNGKMNDIPALNRAATLLFFITGIALNEQQMTTIVHTVAVGITGLSALVATPDDLVGDALSQTLIEHKVLSFEL